MCGKIIMAKCENEVHNQLEKCFLEGVEGEDKICYFLKKVKKYKIDQFFKIVQKKSLSFLFHKIEKKLLEKKT